MNETREKLDLRDRLRDELRAACQERSRLTGVVQTSSGPELEWVLYERNCMLKLVNLLRAERGIPGVDAAEVERADQLATGHVDWFDKFPLYCAELVLRPASETHATT